MDPILVGLPDDLATPALLVEESVLEVNLRDMAELARDAGVALRATFIIDPDNIIRHVQVNDLNVGRNPQEALRILDALQTDELCPCNWNQGDETL